MILSLACRPPKGGRLLIFSGNMCCPHDRRRGPRPARRQPAHRSADGGRRFVPWGLLYLPEGMQGGSIGGANVSQSIAPVDEKSVPSGRPRKTGVRGRRCGDEGACARSRFHRRSPGGFFVPFWPVKKGHPIPRKLKRIAAAMYGGPTQEMRQSLGPFPSSAPVCALGHLPLEGKAFGRGKPLPYGVTWKTFDTGGPGGPPAVDGAPNSSARPGARSVGAQIFPGGTRGGSIGGRKCVPTRCASR